MRAILYFPLVCSAYGQMIFKVNCPDDLIAEPQFLTHFPTKDTVVQCLKPTGILLSLSILPPPERLGGAQRASMSLRIPLGPQRQSEEL